ncbi:DUF4349 domain-containing protein [Chryseobacterium carnipullorum]|uniref:DUF4349 domain-containing protein n=1 Tax=Chryseobacterium carnipullorum TaxID=1124835 RepID=A0A1M7NMH4_CHRCU|nr:DUF4349 domain-containing protein [Chryseobacterium carnipullorum]AZA50791.1 DUF4349 domain-containing protein [Chryseobacterium carnipullorum]AZA65654.1 DUF4349 domain-containing protein [Chryseobacterium carnipullorum]SHN05095.1 protein of unknown function [Chryseobacterium carnipullorum]STD02084.1 Uncharacterised protein [Chryseobacterium carnipullorum]
MIKLFLPLCILLLMSACNKSEMEAANSPAIKMMSEDKVAEEVYQVAPPNSISEKLLPDKNKSPQPSIAPKKLDTIAKKVIKNGNMRIQVGDIKKAQNQVADILKKNEAYIQNEQFQNTDLDDNLDLVIRIPHKNFDALINSFSEGVGSVLSKNISSDDVTEEYTDVSVKLANKKIYLEKYRDMLRSASTTKDMIEIQETIRELEDEIDVAEGRLRFIDDRVNYSTLNLSLYKEKVRSSATSKIGFGSRFADSVTEGWNSFVSFLLGIISFWPFLLLIPILIYLWRKWRTGRKK